MLGERMADLRKDHNMTQEQLAVLLSVGRRTISKYEKGESVPSDETKVKIAQIFHVSLDYLLGLTREQHPYFNDERMIHVPECYTKHDIELLRKFMRFLEDERRRENGGK